MRHATHPADGWEVRICLHGPMYVEVNGEPFDLPWGKPRELVAYVAACGPVHVEIAAEALWPRLAEGLGRQRLRNIIRRARVIVRDGPLLRLPLHTEVEEGLGEILPEYPFEEWAERLR